MGVEQWVAHLKTASAQVPGSFCQKFGEIVRKNSGVTDSAARKKECRSQFVLYSWGSSFFVMSHEASKMHGWAWCLSESKLEGFVDVCIMLHLCLAPAFCL